MEIKDFLRLVNNFYVSKGTGTDIDRINTDIELSNYVSANQKILGKKYKVALVFICLNPLYWEFCKEMVESARQFFLPGHEVDFFFWTDIPAGHEEARNKIREAWASVPEKNIQIDDPNVSARIDHIVQGIIELRKDPHIHLISTEPVQWPYPTLLRYNLFLQEEEALTKYDYIFYSDVDMRFVSIVGDEILPISENGTGITAAQHPMYAIDKALWYPYEPNPKSASFIKRPGIIITDNGKPRFMPLYAAGGFQGGKAERFISAMKVCKEIIERDLNIGYIPIWNDESAWNKYLECNEPEIVLSPSYIYPDSLIDDYYVKKVWWKNYPPKLMTLTKWFSTSKAGGEAVAQMTKK